MKATFFAIIFMSLTLTSGYCIDVGIGDCVNGKIEFTLINDTSNEVNFGGPTGANDYSLSPNDSVVVCAGSEPNLPISISTNNRIITNNLVPEHKAVIRISNL